MSREIKYRIWDKEEEIMFYQLDIKNINFNSGFAHIEEEDVPENEPYDYLIDFYNGNGILMQCTGFKDRNGKDIYKGDIIKYNFKSLLDIENINRERIAPIYWQEFRGCWAVKDNNFGNSDLFRYVQNGNVVEIIGNIYENPELLEG